MSPQWLFFPHIGFEGINSYRMGSSIMGSSYIIDDNDDLWLTGQSFNLGLGGNSYYEFFKADSDVKDFKMARDSSLKLKTDGTLYLCSKNSQYEFIQETIPFLDPIEKIALGSDRIYNGRFSVYLLSSLGELWVKGENSYGQLGLGTTIDTSSYNKVNLNGMIVKDIFVSYSSLFIIDDNDDLWCCGYNYTGVLGLGDSTNRSSLLKVSSISPTCPKVSSISVGIDHASLVDLSGNLWVTGTNTSYQLGTGTTTKYTQFVELSSIIGTLPYNGFIKNIFKADYCTLIEDSIGNIYQTSVTGFTNISDGLSYLNGPKFAFSLGDPINVCVLTSSGNLYSRGLPNDPYSLNNETLGLGSSTLSDSNFTSALKNNQLPNEGVVSYTPNVCGGGYRFIIVGTEDNKIFSLGHYGQGDLYNSRFNEVDTSNFPSGFNLEGVLESGQFGLIYGSNSTNTYISVVGSRPSGSNLVYIDGIPTKSFNNFLSVAKFDRPNMIACGGVGAWYYIEGTDLKFYGDDGNIELAPVGTSGQGITIETGVHQVWVRYGVGIILTTDGILKGFSGSSFRIRITDFPFDPFEIKDLVPISGSSFFILLNSGKLYFMGDSLGHPGTSFTSSSLKPCSYITQFNYFDVKGIAYSYAGTELYVLTNSGDVFVGGILGYTTEHSVGIGISTTTTSIPFTLAISGIKIKSMRSPVSTSNSTFTMIGEDNRIYSFDSYDGYYSGSEVGVSCNGKNIMQHPYTSSVPILDHSNIDAEIHNDELNLSSYPVSLSKVSGQSNTVIDHRGTAWLMGRGLNLGLSGKDRVYPYPIRENIRFIEKGYSSAIKVLEDDSVYTLLDGGNYQLESPGFVTPIKYAGAHNGGSFIVIDSNDDIWVKGDNTYGQLGTGDNNTVINFSKITTSIGTGIKGLSCTYESSYIIDSNDDLWACGYNSDGQLGIGTQIDQNSFVKVVTIDTNCPKVIKVCGGASHSVLLSTTGELRVAGSYKDGALGRGVSSAVSTNFIALSDIGVEFFASPVQQITCGERETLLVDNDGHLWGTGRNYHGNLGLADFNRYGVFTQVSDNTANAHLKNLKAIEAGSSNSTLAISSDDKLYVCGDAGYSALGNYSVTDLNVFTELLLKERSEKFKGKPILIGASGNRVLVIDDEFNSWESGLGGLSRKQVEASSIQSTNYEIQYLTKDNSRFICGENHFFLTNTTGLGGAYAVGDNSNYVLALGSSNSSSIYYIGYSVDRGDSSKPNNGIACTKNGSLICDAVGSIYVHGSTENGSLGVGDTTDPYKTSSYLGVSDALAVWAGYFQSFYKSSSALFATGVNTSGQLGLNNGKVSVLSFTQVTNLGGLSASAISKIVCGETHTLVLDTSGSLWVCGSNQYGQLGYPSSTTELLTFTLWDGSDTFTNSNIIDIQAGRFSTFILSDSGQVWVAGRNDYGQLGILNTTDQFQITYMYNAPNVISLGALGYNCENCFMIKDDNNIYVTGKAGPQRGDGSDYGEANFTVPVKVELKA